jgi:hypothetical protein
MPDEKTPYEQGYTAGFEDGEKEAIRPVPSSKIYAKLAAVMAELPAVGKDSKNEQQGWNFRGVDAVVNAISPALRNHGVIVVPELLECTYRDTLTAGRDPRPTREVTVRVRYTFYAEDGSYVSAVVPGESLDQSDKGSAKAMSVAFRIALLQVFSLPTSEPDPDASYHTRDGVGSMPESTRDMLLAAVPDASIEELGPMWPVVLEHSAAERAIGTAEITWADYFAQRVAEIIESIETAEDGRYEYEALKISPVRHLSFQGEPLTGLMTKRAAFIKQRSTLTYDTHVQAITGATEIQAVDEAFEAVLKSQNASHITGDQVRELERLALDKRAKLERELNQAATVDPSGSE